MHLTRTFLFLFSLMTKSNTMDLTELLNDILKISEKAAHLARAVRSEAALFQLLVEEKTGCDKNRRFVQDFKTLADVLVQEMVRQYLSDKYCGIGDYIFGEESNHFTNTLGETVTVQLQSNAEDTQELLTRVLDGNEAVANDLARLIHSDVTLPDNQKLLQHHCPVDTADIGIWIDPIDSTNQYIHGQHSDPTQGVYSSGLHTVTVLIGVFLKSTGEPIAGVINQPFCYKHESVWHGRCIWGLQHLNLSLNDVTSSADSSLNQTQDADRCNTGEQSSVVMSSSESQAVRKQLQPHFIIRHASGAGYKTLCVIDGLVSAYVLSTGSTSKWDTCGPQAILKSMGGGIVDYSGLKDALKAKAAAGESLRATGESTAADNVALQECINRLQIRYDKQDASGKWCNSNGIVAYASTDKLLQVMARL